MAKKSETKPTAETPRRDRKAKTGFTGLTRLEKAGKNNPENPVNPVSSLRPSALLDTRVVYCGDNLERLGRMQKAEGRMMKPAHFPILHSSFILLHSPSPASHYVKVMLDRLEQN